MEMNIESVRTCNSDHTNFARLKSSRSRSFSALSSRSTSARWQSTEELSTSEITSNECIKKRNPKASSVENILMLTSVPLTVERSPHLSYSEVKNINNSKEYLPHEIAVKQLKKQQESRLSLSVLLAFSATSVGRGSITITLATYAPPFYTDVVGISFGVMGVMVGLILLLYATPQPFLGLIQDAGGVVRNRRKKWLFVSGMLTSLAYFAVLCPPTFNQPFATVWVVFFACLLGPLWGCLDASHDSLGAQLTFDYDERLRIQACSTIALSLGVIVTSIVYGLLGTILNVDTSLQQNRLRMFLICCMGALFLYLGLIATYWHPGVNAPQVIVSMPKKSNFSLSNETYTVASSLALSQKETTFNVFKASRAPSQRSENCINSPLPQRKKPYRISLGHFPTFTFPFQAPRTNLYKNIAKLVLHEIYSVFSNRPALMIMLAMSMGMISALSGALLLQYFVKFVLQSDFLTNWISLLLSASTLVFSFLWMHSLYYAKFLHNKGLSFVLCVGVIAFSRFIVSIFASKGGVFFFLFFTLIGQGIGTGGSLIAALAMKPDVIDYEEFRTGLRKEGLFMGVFLLFSKLLAAVANGTIFFILHVGGFKAGAEPNDQPLLLLKIFFGGSTVVCVLILAVIINAYPITAPVHKLIVKRTQIRHAGGWAIDPVYGGLPLPPYYHTLINSEDFK